MSDLSKLSPDHRSFVEKTIATARAIFATKGSIEPVGFVCAADHIDVVLLDMSDPEHKEASAQACRSRAAIRDASMFVVVAEAFVSTVDRNTPRPLWPRPSTDPAREEAVVVSIQTRSLRMGAIAKVDRSGPRPTLSEWEWLEGMSPVGTLFGNVIPNDTN